MQKRRSTQRPKPIKKQFEASARNIGKKKCGDARKRKALRGAEPTITVGRFKTRKYSANGA
jgi:hypothetical protein